MKTAWSDLPNAKHIDRVIAHVKANPKLWAAAYDAVQDAAWDAALDAVRYEVRSAVRSAILALIVYDNCAHLLDTPVEQVKIMAALGQKAAILLLPTVIAMEKK